MRERQAVQADVEFVGYGEVRQPQPAGWVFLVEVDLELAAVRCEELQRRHPGRFADSVIRTLQRRVGQWPSVTAISDGAPSSIDTTSAHTSPIGSPRVRQCRAGRCEGSDCADFTRRALAADAALRGSGLLSCARPSMACTCLPAGPICVHGHSGHRWAIVGPRD